MNRITEEVVTEKCFNEIEALEKKTIENGGSPLTPLEKSYFLAGFKRCFAWIKSMID